MGGGRHTVGMEILLLVTGLVVGALIGVLVGFAVWRRSGGTGVDPAVLEAQHALALEQSRGEAEAVRGRLAAELAATSATAASLREQIVGLQTAQRELVDRQRAEAEERLARERAESKVLEALAPVKSSLETMQKKVVELESQRSEQHGQLSQQLRSALDSEERLRNTAEALASALRNNGTRGVWGETQLRSVVEAAGLINRVDFDVQTSITSDAGRGRPDMVVHLPGGKSIAVDAKVPFSSYIAAMAIPMTASEQELANRDRLMKEHVAAVRAHITTLGSRAYWDGLDASPEMVIAFIPSESLVSSALEADPTIMEFAFSKRVALSSPVTLWSVLKTVAFSWQQDVVTQEAKTLFDLSKVLYGRLSTLADRVDKLGRSINRTVNDYNAFVGTLERQVLPSARKLSMLDESKILGSAEPVEENARELVAPELLLELEAEPELDLEQR